MSRPWFAASLLAIAATTTAAAAPLRLLTDERSVASFGTASTYTDRIYFDGTPPENTVVQDVKARQPIVYRPVNRTRSFDVSDGTSLRTPLATLDGQGAQSSSFSTSGIRFSGVADVLATASNTSVSGDNYSEIGTGVAGGSAESSARWTFALDAMQPMQLAMSSNLSATHLNGFTFSLTADNGFAWTTPYLNGNDGALFTFSTVLRLRPGIYTLDAHLSAGVHDVQDASRGDRATASFSLLAVRSLQGGVLAARQLSAVPEPATAALALAGLLLLWGAGRARGPVLRRCRRP